jgi:hypothetical protein
MRNPTERLRDILDAIANIERYSVISAFAVRFKHSPHPNPPRARGGSRSSPPCTGEIRS